MLPLAISLFPDLDGLDELIEATMPVFSLWLCALAVVLVVILIGQSISRIRHRSPVDRLLRRRFG